MTDESIDDPPATDGFKTGSGRPGRALVPFAPPSARESFAPSRLQPDPLFVAQLIAAALQMPQTRRLRRAAMQDAVASYHCAREPGRTVREGLSVVI